jgi:hypothetical protein
MKTTIFKNNDVEILHNTDITKLDFIYSDEDDFNEYDKCVYNFIRLGSGIPNSYFSYEEYEKVIKTLEGKISRYRKLIRNVKEF